MKKLQVKQREFRGEITVFLCLIFVLMLSFIGALVESASIHINKSMKRADTKLALESVFAEYDKTVLEKYDVFVKLNEGEQNFSRRLWFYGANDMEHKMQKVRLLTDSSGQAFFEQAVRSVGGEEFEVQTMPASEWERKESDVTYDLDTILQTEGKELPTEKNPMETVKKLKESDFLTLVLGEEQEISGKSIGLEGLPSHRTLRTGNSHDWDVVTEGLTKKFLFIEYLSRHFPTYTKNEKENALFYEAEYILEGKDNDQENLEAVLKQILTVRIGINYAYLLTDQAKQAEAQTVALGLSSLLMAPEASELVKYAVLFAWSYGESIQDLRVLTQGKKVPLIKTEETWQLDLDSLLKMGTSEESYPMKEVETGISYNGYIKMLLALKEPEQLSMRALDLVEAKTGVQTDECITAVRIKSTYEMQRNITDTFITEYRYK